MTAFLYQRSLIIRVGVQERIVLVIGFPPENSAVAAGRMARVRCARAVRCMACLRGWSGILGGLMRAAVPSHLWVCAAALLAAQSDAGLAVTGGVSADAALGARGGAQYSQQQATAARAVLAVTVPLFNADSG